MTVNSLSYICFQREILGKQAILMLADVIDRFIGQTVAVVNLLGVILYIKK